MQKRDRGSCFLHGVIAKVLLSFSIVLAFAFGSAAQAGQLFQPVGNQAALSMTAEQESRAAAIQQDKAHADLEYVFARPAVLGDSSISVPLPNGEITLGLTHRIERAAGDFTWIGQGSGEGGQTVLVVRDNQITGVIYDGFAQYSITPSAATCTP